MTGCETRARRRPAPPILVNGSPRRSAASKRLHAGEEPLDAALHAARTLAQILRDLKQILRGLAGLRGGLGDPLDVARHLGGRP